MDEPLVVARPGRLDDRHLARHGARPRGRRRGSGRPLERVRLGAAERQRALARPSARAQRSRDLGVSRVGRHESARGAHLDPRRGDQRPRRGAPRARPARAGSARPRAPRRARRRGRVLHRPRGVVRTRLRHRHGVLHRSRRARALSQGCPGLRPHRVGLRLHRDERLGHGLLGAARRRGPRRAARWARGALPKARGVLRRARARRRERPRVVPDRHPRDGRSAEPACRAVGAVEPAGAPHPVHGPVRRSPGSRFRRRTHRGGTDVHGRRDRPGLARRRRQRRDGGVVGLRRPGPVPPRRRYGGLCARRTRGARGAGAGG